MENIEIENIQMPSELPTLSTMEHIRIRPKMYIERFGDNESGRGDRYALLDIVLNNSVKGLVSREGKVIEISQFGNYMTVCDNGSGVPLWKLLKQCTSSAELESRLFIVNALSWGFEAVSCFEGVTSRVVFERGILKGVQPDIQDDVESGTRVRFFPDPELFKDGWWEDDILDCLRGVMRSFTGVAIRFNEQEVEFQESDKPVS